MIINNFNFSETCKRNYYVDTFFSLIFMEDQECFLHLPSLSYVKLAFLGLQGKCAVSESLILLLLIFLSIIILLYGFFSKFNFYFFRSSSQIMGYTGINYSSPTLASAISNLTPAFTFVLAIIFRFLPLPFYNYGNALLTLQYCFIFLVKWIDRVCFLRKLGKDVTSNLDHLSIR